MRKLISPFLLVVWMLGIALPAPAIGQPACPDGYRVYQNLASGLVCVSAGDPKTTCPGQSFVYTCGPGAHQCCGINENNPCMAGFYACKYDNFGSGAKHCCKK